MVCEYKFGSVWEAPDFSYSEHSIHLQSLFMIEKKRTIYFQDQIETIVLMVRQEEASDPRTLMPVAKETTVLISLILCPQPFKTRASSLSSEYQSSVSDTWHRWIGAKSFCWEGL